jgi:hypothetical protein
MAGIGESAASAVVSWILIGAVPLTPCACCAGVTDTTLSGTFGAALAEWPAPAPACPP